MDPGAWRCLVPLGLVLAACNTARSAEATTSGAQPVPSAQPAQSAPAEALPGQTSAAGAPSAGPPAAAAPARAAAGATADPRCPDAMVWIEGVCMDRYEAYLVTLGDDGQETPHPPHLRPPKDKDYAARSQLGYRPQAYISRIESAFACEQAGKRLCSLNEWYRACRGPADTTYPYGRRFERGRCNVGRPHLLTLFHGNNPNAWRYLEHFNDPRLDQEPGYLVPTGEFPGCVSGYGAYDLVGNLHEWVSDPVDRTLPSKLPLRSTIRRRVGATTGNGIFMGGFFSTTSEHGSGCEFVTAAHEPEYHDYSTGFRCCSDPEEGSTG